MLGSSNDASYVYSFDWEQRYQGDNTIYWSGRHVPVSSESILNFKCVKVKPCNRESCQTKGKQWPAAQGRTHHCAKVIWQIIRKLEQWGIAGHSLGASVAEISALDLLHSAAQNSEPEPNLKVIGFAAPAIGNQALADFVRQHGWHKHIQNYVLPGLLIEQILLIKCLWKL